jgi:hypothetical protein
MQYFLGYSGFISEKPFDASLFVEIRKRLGMDAINAMNERLIALKTKMEVKPEPGEKKIASNEKEKDDSSGSEASSSGDEISGKEVSPPTTPQPKGRILFDATACPQDIAYPTDLDLLSEARSITERLIDKLYDPGLHTSKPRTYRKVARKRYLRVAQKKVKSKKALRAAIRGQLGYLGRNIRSIHKLLDGYAKMPLKKKDLKYFYVIQTLYGQQLEMFKKQIHTIEDRIVSIHQPHVRPIVRGKAQAKVEFGSKIHLSVIDGISFFG